MQIVLIATAWGTAEGGINAFNQPFAKALALVGGRVDVTCAVATLNGSAAEDARRAGVRLIEVGKAALMRNESCGRRVVAALVDGGAEAEVGLWIGHDVKTGFSATAAAAAFGGRAAIIHHMDYGSYRNLRGGRGEDTAARRDEQIDLFSTPDAILFGVGDDLRASAARLGAGDAFRIVPGFPDGFTVNSSGHDDLHAIVAGRFDGDSEPLKQSRLVAAGLGRAVCLAGANLRALARPTLTVYGATPETIANAELERIAREEAGRMVNVVPAAFDAQRGVLRHLARSNLAVMPSVREGFGLIGWEAIGCGAPLILGDQTGLAKLLDRELEGHADRHVTKLALTGGELDAADVEAMAQAIISVARDLEHSRDTAARLRDILKDRLDGCTWPSAAERFLQDCGIDESHGSQAAASYLAATGTPANAGSSAFDVTVANHREQCAELELDDHLSQGSTDRCLDVLATLRFGITELAVDDLEVSVGLKRALVRVSSEHGRLAGGRLGEAPNVHPGVAASAGGIWELTNPEGGTLAGKVLGVEPLCRIDTPANLPAHVKVEVTAAKRDVVCDFNTDEPIARATESVMPVFLKNALLHAESGHVVLSTGELRTRT